MDIDGENMSMHMKVLDLAAEADTEMIDVHRESPVSEENMSMHMKVLDLAAEADTEMIDVHRESPVSEAAMDEPMEMDGHNQLDLSLFTAVEVPGCHHEESLQDMQCNNLLTSRTKVVRCKLAEVGNMFQKSFQSQKQTCEADALVISCLHSALSMLKDLNNASERKMHRIEILQKLLSNNTG